MSDKTELGGEQQIALLKADILYNVLQSVRVETFGCYIENNAYVWSANGQEEATVDYFMDKARKAAKKMLLEMSNVAYSDLYEGELSKGNDEKISEKPNVEG